MNQNIFVLRQTNNEHNNPNIPFTNGSSLMSIKLYYKAVIYVRDKIILIQPSQLCLISTIRIAGLNCCNIIISYHRIIQKYADNPVKIWSMREDGLCSYLYCFTTSISSAIGNAGVKQFRQFRQFKKCF